MIKFKNVEIPGPHYDIVAQHPEFVGLHRHFFGLGGTNEIRSRGGGRIITVEMWISKKNWQGRKADKLYDELFRLHKLAHYRKHGTLQQKSDTGDQKFSDCTFIGCTVLPFEGHRQPGPIKDEGGTLFVYNNFDERGGAWLIRASLEWYQTDVVGGRTGVFSLTTGP